MSRALSSQLTLFDDQIGREDAFCRHCGRYYAKGREPDPCIGRDLPGVWSCCCGHGNDAAAHVDPDAGWAEGIATLGNPWNWNADQW